jgi:two-component system chemotaxis sensor kinase CheA
MTIDMSQFYQVFFEETAEHLASMEALLLGLDIESPDPEQLNAIFRAAHSIKGSSGTFGFTDLTEVTHILENLLDRIRKGELALRNDMIDAFLDAGDILKELLGAHRGDGAADPASVAAICTRLKQLTADVAAPAQAETNSAQNAQSAVTPALAADTADIGFDIRYQLAEGTQAVTAESLLAELAALGELQVLERPATGETEGNWHLRLQTTADREIVVDLLDFVVRSDSLRVAQLGAGNPSGPAGDAGGAYGFFDDEPDVPVAPAAASANVADDPGGAFGFFTDIPATEIAAPLAEAAAPADDAGGAYGFFVDVAPPVVEPVVEAMPVTPVTIRPNQETGTTPAGTEGDGFGFFVDVPIKPATPVLAVAAAPAPDKETAKEVTAKRAPAAAAAAKAGAENSIRVSVEKVDQMVNLVGELVITQAMLVQSATDVDPVIFERLLNGLAQLERNTRDIQEAVMSIRMMPISVVFSRFPRVVRDLSQKLGKQVELKMIGEGTELDRSLIERIADPLTHLVRNSLDHGVEMPEDRIAKGKAACGTITLKAYHQSGNIVIEVGDDGAGLNRSRILAKAKERGFTVSDAMTDQDVWGLIFEAGFSTAEQITEVSGRGVGMDVVRRNITAMGGRVEIESITGFGTRMTVRLPLTLAILDGMSVAVGRETYLIPLGYVIESLQPTRNMIKSISGVERLIQVRDEYLPVIALFEVFSIAEAQRDFERGIMVILESDGIKAALFVDAMVGQHQVVIKSLEANYRKVSGISGATIMGDGRVAMILDVAALVTLARSALPAAA